MTCTLIALCLCIFVIYEVANDCVHLHSDKGHVSLFHPYGPKMCLNRCDIPKISCNFMLQSLTCIIVSDDRFNTSEHRQTLKMKKQDNCSLSNQDDKTPSLCVYENKFPDYNGSTYKDWNNHTAGDLCLIKYIFAFGCSDDRWHRGVMSYATRFNKSEILSFFVRHHCTIDVTRQTNKDILLSVVNKGLFRVLRILIDELHFDIESKGKHGITPLFNAAEGGHLKILQWLVCKGANLTAVDDRGQNILFDACRYGRLGVVTYMVSLEVLSIDSRCNTGRSPVMMAAWGGHVHVIRFLRENGASTNAVSDAKYNILHMASANGKLDMVKYIVNQKLVNLEAKDRKGQTPLMLAVRRGHERVVRFLVGEGSNVNVRDKKGNTISHFPVLPRRVTSP